MKKAKYIAGLIITLTTTWLHAQINPSTNNIVGGTNTSVAGGDLNKAVAMYGIIGSGFRNTNTAYMATIGGGWKNWTEADHSTIPGGRNARARSYGEMAYASGMFSVQGDAQLGFYVLRGTSVGNNIATLYLDGSDASSSIIVPSNGSFLLDIDILCRGTDDNGNGRYGNFFHYRIAVENQSGNLVMDTLDSSTKMIHNAGAGVGFTSSGNIFIIQGQGENGALLGCDSQSNRTGETLVLKTTGNHNGATGECAGPPMFKNALHAMNYPKLLRLTLASVRLCLNFQVTHCERKSTRDRFHKGQ